MFLDETAFDLDDNDTGYQKNQSRGPSSYDNRPKTSNSYGSNSRPSTANIEDDMDDLNISGGLGSAGALGAGGSRARMLAQQREVQLKKRQNAAQQNGMIRSSVDSLSNSGQFTPAIRQFSAPKAVRGGEQEESDFSRPQKLDKEPTPVKVKQVRRYDDEEEEFDTRGNKNTNSRGNYDRDDRSPRGTTNTNTNGRDNNRRSDDRGFNNRSNSRYDDEDDDDRPYNRNNDRDNRPPRDRDYDDRNQGVRGSNNGGGRGGNKGRRDYDDEEEDYDRRGGRGNGRDDNKNRGNTSRDGRDGSRDGGSRGSGGRGGRDYDEDRVGKGGRGGGRDDRDYDDRDDDRNNDRNNKPKRNGSGSANRDREREYSDEEYERRRGKGKNNDYDDRRDDDRKGNYRRGGDDDRRKGNRGDGSEGEGDWNSASNARGSNMVTGNGGNNNANNRNNNANNNDDIPQKVAVASDDLDLSNMDRFLMTPLPKEAGIVQCYIRRNKSGTNKLFPIYTLYLKDDDKFLMSSRKRPNNKTSNYLISKSEGDLSKEGGNYIGKLRSNFVGTEFQVFDAGLNAKDMENGDHNDHSRKELGVVMYAPNVLGARGPRKMQVCIPSVDERNMITEWKKKHPEGDMLQSMKDRSFRDLIYLINKPPRWNEQVGAYVLNFSGRVTMASVKNFQLVDPDEQNAVLLQFGRVAKDEFTMDMQWPMSPFQAFAITLSSFDSKIACD